MKEKKRLDKHIRVYYGNKGLLDLVGDKKLTMSELGISVYIFRYSYPGEAFAALLKKRTWNEWAEVIPVSEKIIRNTFIKLCNVGFLYKADNHYNRPSRYIRFLEALTQSEMIPYIDKIVSNGEEHVMDRITGKFVEFASEPIKKEVIIGDDDLPF